MLQVHFKVHPSPVEGFEATEGRAARQLLLPSSKTDIRQLEACSNRAAIQDVANYDTLLGESIQTKGITEDNVFRHDKPGRCTSLSMFVRFSSCQPETCQPETCQPEASPVQQGKLLKQSAQGARQKTNKVPPNRQLNLF